MSVLIRGMNMPKCCGDCPMLQTIVGVDGYIYGGTCGAGHFQIDPEDIEYMKHNDCPLFRHIQQFDCNCSVRGRFVVIFHSHDIVRRVCSICRKFETAS